MKSCAWQSCMWKMGCCKERWCAKTNKTQHRPFARSNWKTSLPRETKEDVTKCHAWWMLPSATPATQSDATPRATKARPSAPPEPAQRPKCHACHAKRRWMSPSATSATQSGAAKCHACYAKWRRQVPRLPQSCDKVGVWKMLRDKVVWLRWCVKDGVCVWQNAERRWMSPSATRATQSGADKCHACHKVVTKMVCERCCVTKLCEWDGVWKMVCDKGGVRKMMCDRVGVWKMVGDKVVWVRWCVKDGVWQSWCVKDGVCVCEKKLVWKMVGDKVVWQSWCVNDGVWQNWRERWCVTKLVCERWCRWCVKDGVWQSCVWKIVCDKDGVWKMVCDKVVCERWCVTKWCVKDGVCERWCVTKLCVKDCVYDKDGVWQRWCVKDGAWQSCVWKMVCDRWRRRARRRRRDTESKTRTPHKDVGRNPKWIQALDYDELSEVQTDFRSFYLSSRVDLVWRNSNLWAMFPWNHMGNCLDMFRNSVFNPKAPIWECKWMQFCQGTGACRRDLRYPLKPISPKTIQRPGVLKHGSRNQNDI